jgi:type 1 glutamine amidotransferase
MTSGMPVEAISVRACVARASMLVTIALVVAVACVLAASGYPSADVKPHVVFVTGDDEYRSEITMPMIAAILEARHGLRTSVARAVPRPQTKDNIEGLEALDSADLMVMYTRFRALPDDQLRRILAFTGAGKPLVGFRTTTHAFLYPADSPHRDLNDAFGRDVFGQKWITHHGHRSSTGVTLHDPSRGHPILRGVTPFHARSWLYHVAPLHGDDNTVLLDGTSEGSEQLARQAEFPLTQPVAWTRTHNGARVFFTTLGHPDDFTHESMRRLVVNAVLWALGRDVPPGGADVTVVGTYTPPETFDLSKVQE